MLTELIDLVGAIQSVMGTKIEGDEESKATLIRIISPIISLGDRDLIQALDDFVDAEDVRQKKDNKIEIDVDALEELREGVIGLLWTEVYRIARDLRYEQASLAFVSIDDALRNKISEVLGMLSGEQTMYAMRVLSKASGLASLFPPVDVRARADEYGRKLAELRSLIEIELKRTL